MRPNNIVKYKLESRAKALKVKKKTYKEISEILSSESKQNITISTVFRYFDSNIEAVADIVQKKEHLQAKVAEVEINSINDWLDDIKSISDLANSAWNAGDFRAAAMALKIKVDAREGVNKQLGRISNGVTVNNINAMKLSDVPTEILLRWRDEAKSSTE